MVHLTLDVTIVTETWLHAEIASNLISVADYRLFRLDREAKSPSGTRKPGGGIAIYVRNSFDVVQNYNSSVSTNNLELAHITVRKDKQKCIDLFTFFRPPLVLTRWLLRLCESTWITSTDQVSPY